MQTKTKPKTILEMKHAELKAEGTSSIEDFVCFTVRFSEKEPSERIGCT